MPEDQIAAFGLRPDGGIVLTPPLTRTAANEYRIVVEGVIRYKRTGESFDAMYGTDATGAFSRPHPYLNWTPTPPVLESADPARHRYIFRVPTGAIAEGQSVGLQWNVDRLVEQYLVPPSEVRADLSGTFALTVLQTAPLAGFPWTMLGVAGVTGALLVGGLGVLIRRRVVLAGLSPDLQARLGQIETQLAAARRAVRPEDRRAVPIQERLTMLKSATLALIGQMQKLRRAQSATDAPTLESEIAGLERRRVMLTDVRARREAEAALTQKRRTLTLLHDMAQSEARCALRLAKLEALLENTLVSLQSAGASADAAPSEDCLVSALDAEVSALHEVAREMAQAEPFAPGVALNKPLF